MAELYAVPLLIQQEAEALRGEDCIFFIDNEAAVASLVRVASVQPDAAFIVQVVHAMLVALQCRCWFEWIDTHSNPADGLSRQGLQVPQTQGDCPEWDCRELVTPYTWKTTESPWKIAAQLLGC